MAYQVLARKYRPQLFSDVIGQDHVTRTLLNALAQQRIAHGYIFSGHRGIGKTTIARILASALNCRSEIGSAIRPTPEPCNQCESCLEIRQGNAVDVIEIDAATNRGIDEIRELRDAARYRPSRDKYKIYILDEAHQITDAAFNALLKTLEEPPDHIVFMMATTQPEDIPQTIRSRCQHFSFHAVKLDDIVGQLRLIATAEEISADDATLSLLAEAGDGSMRDALSIMDQAIASAPTIAGHAALDAAQVRELMGSVSNVVYEQILDAVHANNSADVLAIVGRLLDAGNGAPQLARQFVRYLRNTVVAKITGLTAEADATGVAADLLQISPEERKRVARSAAMFTEEELARFLAIVLRTFDDLGYRQEQRFHLELGLLKLVHVQRLLPVEELLSQLGVRPGTKPNTVATPSTAPAPAPTAAPQPSMTKAPALQAATLPSPLESDRSRKLTMSTSTSAEVNGALHLDGGAPVAATALRSTATAGSLALAPLTVAATERVNAGPQLVAPIETFAEVAAIADATVQPLDLTSLHQAMIAALEATKGQSSAAQQLEEATLSLHPDALHVQTSISALSIPAIFNAEAERLLKAALRQAGAGNPKLIFLPGTTANRAAAKTKRPAAAGSIAEVVDRHPMVQQARELFAAEISNIVDLRGKDESIG